jgi:hypothetical protein
MASLFIEGGWGMYPVLVFGLMLLWASGRYAHDLQPARLRFSVAMAVVVIISAFNAMLTAVAATLWYVQDPVRTPDAEFARTLVTGLKESSRAGALGGVLLTLAAVLVAVGVYRAGRRELAKAKG